MQDARLVELQQRTSLLARSLRDHAVDAKLVTDGSLVSVDLPLFDDSQRSLLVESEGLARSA